MAKEVAAVVAATAETRGIGYQGQLVRRRGRHTISFLSSSPPLTLSWPFPLFVRQLSYVLLSCYLTHYTYTQPWKLPGDMRYFKKLTSEAPAPGQVNAVLMGRATWESIPSKFRPLPGRVNCVLSRNPDYPVPAGVHLASSLEDAVAQMQQVEEVGRLFVIGGGQIYQQALEQGLCDKVYYTEVSNLPADTKVDAFFPALSPHDWDVQDVEDGDNHTDDKENVVVHTDPKSGATYRFLVHTARPSNPEEDQYLTMCRDILERGNRRGDRTGTGTLSLFGTQMRFSLRDGRLPLLTTKRTFWRGVAEELLWFVSVRVVRTTMMTTSCSAFAFFYPRSVSCVCVCVYMSTDHLAHLICSLSLSLWRTTHRAIRMRTTWPPRIFTFGMAMVRANFSTRVA